MKNYYLSLFIILAFSSTCFNQTPFSTLVKEPLKLELKNNNGIQFFTEASIDKEIDNETIFEPKRSLFFNNNSLSLSVLDIGANRLSVSSQVLHYKLFFFNQNESVPDDEKRDFKINLPLLLISKLSTTYDSVNASGAIDVLDYEAAPITLRTMPSFRLPINTINDNVLFGFYVDARALNIQDPISNNYTLRIAGSGGVGFTYEGDGEAGQYNESGSYQEGRFTISAMLQGAIAEKGMIQELFVTEQKYIGSFQAYLTFNALTDKSLNLKIGYQQFFQESSAGTKTRFSIALGI